MVDVSRLPEVSVVMAAYNAGPYIRRAAESVLRQTGVSLELIIIDNVSTDNTREVVRDLSDPRVVLIERTVNGGPGRSRNDGLANARGDWVAIVDADDEMAPERFRCMIDRANQTDSDIVVDNIEQCFSNGQRALMYNIDDLKKMAFLDLHGLVSSSLFLSAKKSFGYTKPILKRSLIERLNLTYKITIDGSEDYIFLWEALAGGGRCVIEPQAGYHYFIRGQSMSRSISPEQVMALRAVEGQLQVQYRLTAKERSAQRRREASMDELVHLLRLVGAIKRRKPGAAVRVVLRHPAVLVWAGVLALRRLFPALA